ncbi:DUF3192 domain-containing protein [Simiduia aestuariiviva]|uniref:DUF3192 domain-containing protein n=1 Tax=Simiduia aestuariiviva TaxID=1510459 RepID=A0A839USC2_9GAMM|nr:DUF3192 domain-containing protein [Simiduia aestuariiviva]MBB3169370.1 hypothetical protein [Simiduia aestuariiviva]
MGSVTRLVALSMLVSLLSACVINVGKDGDYYGDWDKREQKNRKVISSLVLDQSEQQIRDQLGDPDFSEGFKRDGAQYRVLFYRTQRQAEDGKTTKDECTPLIFRAGELVGWGEKAYNGQDFD